MDPKELAENYDCIAAYWDGKDFDRANGIDSHKRAVTFVKEPGAALDIGCGSSGRIIDLLRESGFAVEGIDISEEMVRRARKRHPSVEIHWADICEWEFEKRYSFITAWDSIWHLDIERQKRVLWKISEGLEVGGIFIFTTGGVYEPAEHTDPCLGKDLFYGVLGIPKLLQLLQDCGLGLRHFEFDQYPEKHLYLIVQKM